MIKLYLKNRLYKSSLSFTFIRKNIYPRRCRELQISLLFTDAPFFNTKFLETLGKLKQYKQDSE